MLKNKAKTEAGDLYLLETDEQQLVEKIAKRLLTLSRAGMGGEHPGEEDMLDIMELTKRLAVERKKGKKEGNIRHDPESDQVAWFQSLF